MEEVGTERGEEREEDGSGGNRFLAELITIYSRSI
jgi:hypothetical protein